MKKITRDVSGFGALELIVIVVVIGLLGSVGWLLYERQHTTTSVTTTTTQDAASTVANGKTIKLSKMAIQFDVPDSLETLRYIEATSTVDTSVKSGYGSEAYQIAFFSTPAFEASDSCKLTSTSGALGSVWKVPGQYPSDASDQNSPGTLVKQFPSFYLAFREPRMACSTDDTLNTQATTLQAALSTALASSSEIK